MPDQRLEKIEQYSLRESVYNSLRIAFNSGQYGPGDKLSLRDLADQLGTSPTPVREAVRRLVAEGALLDTPGRTLKVPEVDQRRMEDLKAARLALECLALDLAVANATNVEIEEIENLLVSSENSKSGKPDLQKNYDFHSELYRLSQSKVILPLIESLWLQYGTCMHPLLKNSEFFGIDENIHHFEIVEAMKQRDAEAARSALRKDIERSFSILFPDSSPSK